MKTAMGVAREQEEIRQIRKVISRILEVIRRPKSILVQIHSFRNAVDGLTFVARHAGR
jgi:hypothetical protein